MSRPIKFRAWDKKRGEWYGESDPEGLTFKDFHLFGECMMFCMPHVDDVMHLEITQFTGLLDCKGVEIWEGDILQVGKLPRPADVYFDKGSFWVTGKEENRWLCDRLLSNLASEFHNIAEVIGSIHQHPELLEQS